MPDADVLIAGAGLAGASAALRLSADHDVLLLEADRPAAGASGAAAGLVNPLMGRKAKAVWRLPEALDAFYDTLDVAGASDLFDGGGLLRPTVEDKQVTFFHEAIGRHPDVADWWPEATVRERFPDVQTCGGALWIPRGGAIAVPPFVEAMLDAARARGATVQTGPRVTGWSETGDHATVEVTRDDGSAEHLTARHVILALGYGYTDHAELSDLGLHGVKGQTVRVRCAEDVGPLRPMSGRGYIVPDPSEANTLILGSSYVHDFDDVRPSDESTEYIVDKTANMCPAVRDAEVVDAVAGVRVYADQSNLPIVGPLPGRARIWAFTALGSKGLLTAPLIARELPGYLADPTTIPAEIRIAAASAES